MNKKELVKIINEIVKKQVQKEINKIFIKEDKELTLTDAVTFTSKKEKKDIKSYSKNPVLNKILNETKIKISIEAGITECWKKYIGENGLTFGVDDFGKSAPYKKIYEHFNLTSDNIVKLTRKMLGK